MEIFMYNNVEWKIKKMKRKPTEFFDEFNNMQGEKRV